MHLLLRYTQALITQWLRPRSAMSSHARSTIVPLAAVESGSAAWNGSGDDAGADRHMLGVRREGVTESALKLQRAGLIRYARGHISGAGRAGLEGEPANVTRRSRANTPGCFPMRWLRSTTGRLYGAAQTGGWRRDTLTYE